MRLGYAKGNTLSIDQRGQAEMVREMSLDNRIYNLHIKLQDIYFDWFED